MIWFFLKLVYRIPSNIWQIFMSFGRRAVYSLLIVWGKDWKSLPTNAKSIIWEKNGMVRKPPPNWTTTSNAPYNLKINITRETQRFLN